MTGVNPKPDHICVHAFIEDEDGGQEYTDDISLATGWCVYNFHEGQHSDPDDPQWTGEIDVNDEEDFATYKDAMQEAEFRSLWLGVPIQEY